MRLRDRGHRFSAHPYDEGPGGPESGDGRPKAGGTRYPPCSERAERAQLLGPTSLALPQGPRRESCHDGQKRASTWPASRASAACWRAQGRALTVGAPSPPSQGPGTTQPRHLRLPGVVLGTMTYLPAAGAGALRSTSPDPDLTAAEIVAGMLRHGRTPQCRDLVRRRACRRHCALEAKAVLHGATAHSQGPPGRCGDARVAGRQAVGTRGLRVSDDNAYADESIFGTAKFARSSDQGLRRSRRGAKWRTNSALDNVDHATAAFATSAPTLPGGVRTVRIHAILARRHALIPAERANSIRRAVRRPRDGSRSRSDLQTRAHCIVKAAHRIPMGRRALGGVNDARLVGETKSQGPGRKAPVVGSGPPSR